MCIRQPTVKKGNVKERRKTMSTSELYRSAPRWIKSFLQQFPCHIWVNAQHQLSRLCALPTLSSAFQSQLLSSDNGGELNAMLAVTQEHLQAMLEQPQAGFSEHSPTGIKFQIPAKRRMLVFYNSIWVLPSLKFPSQGEDSIQLWYLMR